MKQIFIGLPMWGKPHVELWGKYCLPSMLAPGNLAKINTIAPTTLLIYCDAESETYVTAVPAFKELQDTVSVVFQGIGKTPAEFVEILHPGSHHGGTCYKNCQNMAIKKAWENDSGYICFGADNFWANSLGAKIEETLNSGKRALMNVGYGVGDAFLQYADRFRDGSAIGMPPLELSKAYLWSTGNGTLPPSITESNFGQNAGNLRWGTQDGRGMLLRPHHVNVPFIYAERGPVVCAHGTDHELAMEALTSWDQVNAVHDSTEHMAVGINVLGDSGPDLAPAGRVRNFPPYTRELAAMYLKVATSPWHRHWMEQHWWAHDGTVTPADPVRQRVEAESDVEIAAILEIYNQAMEPGGMTPHLQDLEYHIRVYDY
jgi:hypothetical protein